MRTKLANIGAITAITVLCATHAVGAGEATPGSADPARTEARPGPRTPRKLVAQVLEIYPHDRTAFTQGLLLFDRDVLFESTGLHGRSSLRAVELSSGTVNNRVDLAPELFGEGLARVEDELIQLTWQTGIARVYRLADLELVRELRYQGEGWGLCFDGELLVMSDGSHRLHFRDPTSFALVHSIEVEHTGKPLSHLNELECVGDSVLANVWTTSKIVEIDKRTGTVSAEIDASGVLSPEQRSQLPRGAVLNGIAFDPDSGTFLITGKLWPFVLRVRFAPSDK
jgi:glutaminyl-peptide cyclotransferase